MALNVHALPLIALFLSSQTSALLLSPFANDSFLQRENTSYSEQSTKTFIKDGNFFLTANLTVNLTTAKECQDFQKEVTFSQSNSTVIMTAYSATTFVHNQFCSWLVSAPRDMSIKITFEYFDMGESGRRCAEGILRAIDGDNVNGESLFDYCRWGLPDNVLSDDDKLLLQISLFAGIRNVRLKITFEVIPDFDRPKLQVVYWTSWEGYVTSPNFDGYSKYPLRVSHNVTLDLPPGHVIMIGFQHFDLHSLNNTPSCSSEIDDSVSLFELTESGERLVWRKCGLQSISPRVFNHSVMVTFFSGGVSSTTGFNMTFTIHTQEETPHQLEDMTFDCQAPNYSDFEVHLHCNLVVECAYGEDERFCPYNSGRCNGSMAFEDHCYDYFDLQKMITWTDAFEECQKRGAVLASLNTPREWTAIESALDFGHRASVVFIGLRTAEPKLPALYIKTWQWADESIAYFVHLKGHHVFPSCAALPWGWDVNAITFPCDEPVNADFICEYPAAETITTARNVPEEAPAIGKMDLPSLSAYIENMTMVVCPRGHLTFDFMACNPETYCQNTRYQTSCRTELAGSMPTFACDDEVRTLPYTLVCDHRHDCLDNSDEEFCVHAECPDSTCTQSPQCLSYSHWCDGMQHCVDGTDEDNCYNPPAPAASRLPPPAVIFFDGFGNFTQQKILPNASCPDTHFRCGGELAYCLPVHARCNGVRDCPGNEDEQGCDRYDCPGFYRCRASTVCVHVTHVCDGVYHCPMQDDERMCRIPCPPNCRCQGRSYICHQHFNAVDYPNVRYLDASGSGLTPQDLKKNLYLIWLILRDCNLEVLEPMSLPNLRRLDLSHNRITSINMAFFHRMVNLRILNLSHNLVTHITSGFISVDNLYLQNFDLSRNFLREFDTLPFANFSNIRVLNISFSTIHTIRKAGFTKTKKLEVLDMRETPVENFPGGMLKTLSLLRTVYAANFRICCKATLPRHLDTSECIAPTDELSSCEDLLRTTTFRFFLWAFAAMAIVGNVGCFIYRLCIKETVSEIGFDVLVTNLSMSDFLIGVYLVIIGTADRAYHGTYIWHDRAWKNSVFCKTAGFLGLLSSEVSAFIICLITLDRFLVFRYPFSVIRFRRRSAQVACGIVWLIGLALAGVPLLPVTSHWHFYGQTGICAPLPIHRDTVADNSYAFAVINVLNLILFLLIAVGQLLIFLSVRSSNSPRIDSGRQSQDMAIARTLATIVLTDFLCWFPVAAVGHLARQGVPISDEVNVGMAIFVLPLNSAINPFLYTFNMQIDRRRRARERSMLQSLEKKILHEVCAHDEGSNTSMKLNLSQREIVDRIRALVETRRSSGLSARSPSVSSKRSKFGNRQLDSLDEAAPLLSKQEAIELIKHVLQNELVSPDEILSLLTSQSEPAQVGNVQNEEALTNGDAACREEVTKV